MAWTVVRNRLPDPVSLPTLHGHVIDAHGVAVVQPELVGVQYAIVVGALVEIPSINPTTPGISPKIAQAMVDAAAANALPYPPVPPPGPPTILERLATLEALLAGTNVHAVPDRPGLLALTGVVADVDYASVADDAGTGPAVYSYEGPDPAQLSSWQKQDLAGIFITTGPADLTSLQTAIANEAAARLAGDNTEATDRDTAIALAIETVNVMEVIDNGDGTFGLIGTGVLDLGDGTYQIDAGIDAVVPSAAAVTDAIAAAIASIPPPSGGSDATLVDAKGDLLVGTADNTLARFPAGTNGYGLIADSTKAGGLLWTPRSRSIADVHADAAFANTAAQQTLASLAVPADVVAGDILQMLLTGELLNNTAGNASFTFAMLLGATTPITTSAASLSQSPSPRQWRIRLKVLVVDPAADQRMSAEVFLNAPGAAQLPIGTGMSAGQGRGTAGEDLTAGGKNLAVKVTMGVANAAVSITLHEAVLEVAKR